LSTRERQLWLLAGANGAGKTTFHRLFLEPRGVALVNADRIARSIRPGDPAAASVEAAQQALILADHLLENGVPFCFETVFSHPSKIDLMARAKALGYRVLLVFVHLDDIDLNLARISQRVAAGGHDVPEDRVRSRAPRVIDNIASALPLADEVFFLDNSSAEDPFRPVGRMRDGAMETSPTVEPEWLTSITSPRRG
jgi:predicted ABC-type ATPase